MRRNQLEPSCDGAVQWFKLLRICLVNGVAVTLETQFSSWSQCEVLSYFFSFNTPDIWVLFHHQKITFTPFYFCTDLAQGKFFLFQPSLNQDYLGRWRFGDLVGVFLPACSWSGDTCWCSAAVWQFLPKAEVMQLHLSTVFLWWPHFLFASCN